MAEINVTLDKGENVVEIHAKRESPVIQVEIIGSGPQGKPGTDGYSPTITTEEITGGHRLTIIDRDHPAGQTVDVMDGQDGQDGADGYTPVKGVDYFDGQDGADGYTPVKGVDYFDGADGQDGQDGAPGADGAPGVGVPSGGTTGQVLKKASGTDYDTEWGNESGGATEIFVATYGTTTNAQIETALSAGQEVFCKLTSSGVDYYLPLTRRYSATDHRFAAQYSATDIYTIGCSCISNAWNSWNRRIMPMPSSPSTGDVLTYNGSAWAAAAVPTEVFWATYGTTTSAQINAADSAGKIVMCKRTGSVYLMVFNEENYAIFTCVDTDSKTIYSLICNESTWNNSSLVIPYASSATPQALGTAAAGSSSDYSRADHVHAKPSASDVGAVAVAQGVGHSGEFLVVGSDGNVTTVTLATWSAGSY